MGSLIYVGSVMRIIGGSSKTSASDTGLSTLKQYMVIYDFPPVLLTFLSALCELDS
jgi:hypothetical protein